MQNKYSQFCFGRQVKNLVFIEKYKLIYGCAPGIIAALNEKSFERVRIPIEFIVFTYTQISFGNV